MKGRFRVIGKLKDEDKWLGFTKRQLPYVLVAIYLIIQIVKFTYSIHMILIGGFIATAIAMAAFLLCKYEINPNKYLKGGGYGIDIILFRMLIRKLPANKIIYAKGLEKGGIEE